jgi:hypothetical protein
MKKINLDGLRRLIVEAIEEELDEAKKKVEEADEENPLGQDPGRTDIGMNSKDFNPTDQELSGMMQAGGSTSVPTQLNQPKETIIAAIDGLSDKNDMTKRGAWSVLVSVAEWVIGKDKEIKKATESASS